MNETEEEQNPKTTYCENNSKIRIFYFAPPIKVSNAKLQKDINTMEHKIPKAFFAYPSNPPTLKESIQEAVHILNSQGHVKIKTWEDCSIGGNFIIDTICREIDEADLFLADLTGLNANVMFELGYAIARKKRVWLIFDETYKKGKNMFNQLKVLTTVGYVSCCNSKEIVSKFYKENPTDDIENTIFRTAIEPGLKPGGYHRILHLKSQHENETAVGVSNLLQKRLSKRIIVDDPRESTVRTLTWYGSRVFDCKGLICHFTNPEREGAYLQTTRHALVCGMAHGSEIPLLMIAEGDFLSPIDYREHLKNYSTAREALEYVEDWLPSVEQTLKIEPKIPKVPRSATRLARDLRNLRFGDYVAENEEENLVGQYFIQTAAYDDAVKGKHTVFVGRKGSGKTANLIKLRDELSRQKQNVVCVIKPPPYQMGKIVALLKRYEYLDVKEYTIESLWKFLLLTEVANTAYNNLENSPSGPIDTTEQQFCNFVKEHQNLICDDFSARLEVCIQKLQGAIDQSNYDKDSSLPISEALHSGILRQLREELGNFLSKNQRVAILVDNLDTAWDRQNDMEVLCEILWGLLEVGQGLPAEFQRRDSRRQSISINLAIFLRTDIFYKIRKVALEPDKVKYTLLKWDDMDLLCRVIEERFLSAFETATESEVLWDHYFCPTVNGIPTKDYITDAILKRPRDIIYLVNAAVTTAINKRHVRIEEEDILAAEIQYSQYALESVNVENTLPDINLEDVMFEFVEMPINMSKSDVQEIIKSAGVSEDQIEPTIEVLHDLTFLGLEIGEDRFVFSDDPESSRKNKIMARRFARRKGQEERFQIHRVFRAFLETEEM